MQLYDWYPNEDFEPVGHDERAYYCIKEHNTQQGVFLHQGDQIYCLDHGNEVYPSDWKLYRDGNKITMDSLWNYAHHDEGLEQGFWADAFIEDTADICMLVHALKSLKLSYGNCLRLYRDERLIQTTVKRSYLHLDKVNENTFHSTYSGDTFVCRSIGFDYGKDIWVLKD